jgi:hypothetical protein
MSGRCIAAAAVKSGPIGDVRVAAREDGDLLAFSHLDRIGLTRAGLDLRLRLGSFLDALHIAAFRRCARYATL